MKTKLFTISASLVRDLLARGKWTYEYREVKEEDIDYSDIPELTEDQVKHLEPCSPFDRLKAKKAK